MVKVHYPVLLPQHHQRFRMLQPLRVPLPMVRVDKFNWVGSHPIMMEVIQPNIMWCNMEPTQILAMRTV